MFRILTKSKKGFTLVELIVVILLLSFGVAALANMFKITYRAFEKSEERSIKQEAVKTVAEMLREGQTNVAAAMSADIFNTTDIIPPNAPDATYSYLFFEPHAYCKSCESNWDFTNGHCSKVTEEKQVTNGNGQTTVERTYCNGERDKIDGYFLKCMNKGKTKDEAFLLSDVPLYVKFQPMQEEDRKNPGNMVNLCGMYITLAALENDFDYESQIDVAGAPQIDSDYIYYSLDVSYHFPNMVLSEAQITVNEARKGETSTAKTYTASGEENGVVEAVDEGGVVLRVYSDTILSVDDSNVSVTTPTLCFIATASYGHDSGEVGLLCKFRDECLLTNPLGTAFVNAYYKLSPPIADFIRESEPLKAVVRVALKPLVAIATNALDSEAAAENAPWFIVFMLCSAGSTAMVIKLTKQRKRAKKAENQ